MKKIINKFKDYFKGRSRYIDQRYSHINLDKNILVTFEELSKIEVGGVFYIENLKDEVIAKTVRQKNTNSGNLVFFVEIVEGGIWIDHNHDCVETILVKKGIIYDELAGVRIKKRQVMEIPAFQTHLIVAETEAEFFVQFQNPNNK